MYVHPGKKQISKKVSLSSTGLGGFGGGTPARLNTMKSISELPEQSTGGPTTTGARNLRPSLGLDLDSLDDMDILISRMNTSNVEEQFLNPTGAIATTLGEDYGENFPLQLTNSEAEINFLRGLMGMMGGSSDGGVDVELGLGSSALRSDAEQDGGEQDSVAGSFFPPDKIFPVFDQSKKNLQLLLKQAPLLRKPNDAIRGFCLANFYAQALAVQRGFESAETDDFALQVGLGANLSEAELKTIAANSDPQQQDGGVQSLVAKKVSKLPLRKLKKIFADGPRLMNTADNAQTEYIVQRRSEKINEYFRLQNCRKDPMCDRSVAFDVEMQLAELQRKEQEAVVEAHRKHLEQERKKREAAEWERTKDQREQDEMKKKQEQKKKDIEEERRRKLDLRGFGGFGRKLFTIWCLLLLNLYFMGVWEGGWGGKGVAHNFLR